MREAGVVGIGLNELDRNNESGVRGGASQGTGQPTFMVSNQKRMSLGFQPAVSGEQFCSKCPMRWGSVAYA